MLGLSTLLGKKTGIPLVAPIYERFSWMVIEATIQSMREQITGRLRDDILTGRLAEGERLHEAKLAERFGVSRAPIREVLAQLTHEGLLEAKPNCGVKVAPSDSESVRDLIVPI